MFTRHSSPSTRVEGFQHPSKQLNDLLAAVARSNFGIFEKERVVVRHSISILLLVDSQHYDHSCSRMLELAPFPTSMLVFSKTLPGRFHTSGFVAVHR